MANAMSLPEATCRVSGPYKDVVACLLASIRDNSGLLQHLSLPRPCGHIDCTCNVIHLFLLSLALSLIPPSPNKPFVSKWGQAEDGATCFPAEPLAVTPSVREGLDGLC